MQIRPFPQGTEARPCDTPHRPRRAFALNTAWLTALVSVLAFGCLSDEDLSEASVDSENSTGTGTENDSGSDSENGNSAAMDTGSQMGGNEDMNSTSDDNQMTMSSDATNSDQLMSLLDQSNGAGEAGVYVGMTEAHNLIRAELETDNPMPALQWDVELSAFAQQWSDELATRCGSIDHREQRSYGENIAIRGSRPNAVSFAPAEAVDGWAAEIACWDFGTIVGRSSSAASPGQESCDLQCANDLFANGCGHYTQLVWRDSEKVGCGYSTCQADGWNYGVWVCNYDPPGNFIGREPY